MFASSTITLWQIDEPKYRAHCKSPDPRFLYLGKPLLAFERHLLPILNIPQSTGQLYRSLNCLFRFRPPARRTASDELYLNLKLHSSRITISLRKASKPAWSDYRLANIVKQILDAIRVLCSTAREKLEMPVQ